MSINLLDFLPKGGCKPYRTRLMKLKGVDWIMYSGYWFMVCTECGGNCGQCGLTDYVDPVPAKMSLLVQKVVNE